MTIEPGACADSLQELTDNLGCDPRAISGREHEPAGRAVAAELFDGDLGRFAHLGGPVPGCDDGGPGLPGGLGDGRAFGGMSGWSDDKDRAGTPRVAAPRRRGRSRAGRRTAAALGSAHPPAFARGRYDGGNGGGAHDRLAAPGRFATPLGPRLRRAINSATMLMAISGTVCEPMSRPTGAATRARSASAMPASRRLSKISLIFRLLPISRRTGPAWEPGDKGLPGRARGRGSRSARRCGA